MESALQLMAQWCRGQPIPGTQVEIRRLAGRTPLLLIDVPGDIDDCVLLYGHLDKQPEFTGWAASLVVAENIRSVPTAITGDWVKRSTSMGVMSETPQTPVRPTMMPTKRPAATQRRGLNMGYEAARCANRQTY